METKVIVVGIDEKAIGTIALGADGLRYTGDVEELRAVVAYFRRPGLSDADLLDDLPKRLRSRYWAVKA